MSYPNLKLWAYCTARSDFLIQGKYQLIKPMREGSQNHPYEVYEVNENGMPKVLKVLTKEDELYLKLFNREAEFLRRLNHPVVPKLEDNFNFPLEPLFNEGIRRVHCIVMEKIEGLNLQQWLYENSKIPEQLALDWLQQLLEILALLHKNNLFHRDIKPSNIMLRPNGQLVLIDFGTVREMTNTFFEKLPQQQVTWVFSRDYTSPEQDRGQAVPQSDFFALGRTFIYLLTGKDPNYENHKTGKLNWRPYAPEVSEGFANLLDDLIAYDYTKRPQNTQKIVERLQDIWVETNDALKAIESAVRLNFADLPKPLRFLAEEFLKHHLKQLTKQKNRVPKIALFGRQGVGKSSLINAILGKDAAVVGVGDRSRTLQSDTYRQVESGLEVVTSSGLYHEIYQRAGWRLEIIDSRGIGDSPNDAASQEAINYIVKNKVDIVLFVIPATNAYVPCDLSFLKELKDRHFKAHKVELQSILVINRIDEITPIGWEPPYYLNLVPASNQKRTAKKAKEANILACIAARVNDYNTLISSYVPVCAYQDDYGENRLYQIDILTQEIYKYIPDEAAKQVFAGAADVRLLKKAVAERFALAAVWIAFFARLIPISTVATRIVFTTQLRLVSMIAQIADKNEDKSSIAEDFLNQLRIKPTNNSTFLAKTLAIKKAAISYFIEGKSITEAYQAFTQEQERREPEFREAEKKGSETVVDIIKVLEHELNQMLGINHMKNDDDDDDDDDFIGLLPML